MGLNGPISFRSSSVSFFMRFTVAKLTPLTRSRPILSTWFFSAKITLQPAASDDRAVALLSALARSFLSEDLCLFNSLALFLVSHDTAKYWLYRLLQGTRHLVVVKYCGGFKYCYL